MQQRGKVRSKNSKYQSSCLRRSGSAQAGKCQMNVKWLNIKALFLKHLDFELDLNFGL
jgi:hypothetical protein